MVFYVKITAEKWDFGHERSPSIHRAMIGELVKGSSSSIILSTTIEQRTNQSQTERIPGG